MKTMLELSSEEIAQAVTEYLLARGYIAESVTWRVGIEAVATARGLPYDLQANAQATDLKASVAVRAPGEGVDTAAPEA